MTQDLDCESLTAQLKARGLKVVPVIADATRDGASGDLFDGNLEAYLDCLTTLSATVVRISRAEFAPSIFDEPPDEDDEARLEASPALGTYRNRVGEVFSVRLSAVSPELDLDFVLQAEWYDAFLAAVEAADAAIAARESAADEELEAETEARRDELLEKLRAFEDDEECMALKTQTQIRAYVLSKEPELDELLSAELKEGVGHLSMKAALWKKKRPR